MHHSCCHRSALDESSAHCSDCGGPLLRCAAFEECSGLVDTDGLCEVCIAPALVLDGALEARVGGALSIPLTVKNTARIARPLFLVGVWVRGAGGEWVPHETVWDRLDGDEAKALTIHAKPFEREGAQRLDVAFAFASRWRWREEVFAYTTGLEVKVDGDSAVTVQQNITYAADAPQTGATIYAPLRFEGGSPGARSADTGRRVLDLMRAPKLERTLGLRGTPAGPAVPRGVNLAWSGFERGCAPTDGPLVTHDGALGLGRSRTKSQGGTNDVRLLARTRDGAVDEDDSLGISRRHLTLWIENDRLMARVDSDRGAYLNGSRLKRDETHALEDGDVLAPLASGRAGLRVHTEAHHGVCHTVRLSASPA